MTDSFMELIKMKILVDFIKFKIQISK